MEALNLTHLSQSLHKSSSTISKTSPRFTKEPLPSPITTPTNPPPSQAPPSQAPPSQAPPSQATTSLAVQTIEPHLSPVTTTPTTVQATEATPSQVTTPRSVQETETTHFQETSSHSEDVVEDEPEISQKRNFTFWDVEVINEAGHISKTHLRVSDVLEAPPNVSRIITRWNSNGQPVGSAAGLLGGFLGEIARKFKDFPIMYDNWKLVPSTRKNEIFKDKIQVSIINN
uniref:Mucin-2-like n=1 Tax=Cicer arietinum TaxID=3827 RepID=A0A3Q7XSY3_CICAR|nr:mucin-2-like [Cicer arietinum]